MASNFFSSAIKMSKLLVIIGLFCIGTVYCSSVRHVVCKPRKVVLRVEKPLHFHPFHYEAYRCSGGRQDPLQYRCIHTKTKTFQLVLRNMKNNAFLNETMIDHTECREKCICGWCKERNTDAKEYCRSTEQWDKDKCQCIADCPPRSGPSGRTGDNNEWGPFQIATVTLTVILVLVFAIFFMGKRVWKKCQCKCEHERIPQNTEQMEPIANGNPENNTSTDGVGNDNSNLPNGTNHCTK